MKCQCGCNESVNFEFGAFIVQPSQVVWFVNSTHRQKYQGIDKGVDITSKKTENVPFIYTYS